MNFDEQAGSGGAGTEGGIGSPLDYAMARQDGSTIDAVRRALERGDAALAFQPVVQADRPSQPAFHEGLIRVFDEYGRIVPLADFMPYAESTRMGRQIDCIALALGLDALRDDSTLRLSINMSARSIGDHGWMDTLRRGIGRDSDLAERLILEITESSAMDMPDTVRSFMRDLQSRGISFALDDFGAGYTSFRYLRDFNFDMLKIDGQFIREINAHPDNQILTQALQAIAHHFDMFTVAESVETAEDAAYLIDMGIDCLQGYYFGAPTLTPPWRCPQEMAK